MYHEEYYKQKKVIDESIKDIFIAEEDIDWNGIIIFRKSLVTIDDNYIYVNETPLNFFSLLENQYGDKLKDFKKGDSFVIKNDSKTEHTEQTIIRNGEMLRWNNDKFSNRCIPFEKELIDLPTFKYKGAEYSCWGYKLNIKTKDVEGAFYRKDGKFLEMTGVGLEDIEVK